MTLRSDLLYRLCRGRLPHPAIRTVDYGSYQAWRMNSLSESWKQFSDADVRGKCVLDFGCGDGMLGLFLAANKAPMHVIGVDLNPTAIERATSLADSTTLPPRTTVEFRVGLSGTLPLAGESIDTVIAFDCLEHVMSPLEIFREWRRVLRPGGKCLLEWYPFKGPWGPHMESLIPVPWAHVLFGQDAMFRAAERIYDLSEFVPRHWDLDESGQKLPNKWRQWSSFAEQAYVNELDFDNFHSLVDQANLKVSRFDTHSFGGSALRKNVGRLLMKTPLIGEYFVSYSVIELAVR